MTNDFLNLLLQLNTANVKFVIIGGFAGIVHGCTFVTQDVDICCEFSVDNLLRLQNALSHISPVHRMTPQKIKLELAEDNCGDYKNLYLDTDLGQLDCIGSVKGVGDFCEVVKVSQKIEVEGQLLDVLTIDALIEAKKALDRPHDKEAVIQLEAIKKNEKQ